jgi:hypothetical protein
MESCRRFVTEEVGATRRTAGNLIFLKMLICVNAEKFSFFQLICINAGKLSWLICVNAKKIFYPSTNINGNNFFWHLKNICYQILKNLTFIINARLKNAKRPIFVVV